MAQITSREELEEWLKDKPADWWKVIAARAALRVLPYAYVHRLRDEWVKDFSHTLFRITSIFWAESNVPTRNMTEALHLALRSKKIFADSTGYEEAGVATYAAIVAITDQGISACDAVAQAIFSAARDGYPSAAFAAADQVSEPAFAAVWQNIAEDCNWLGNFDNPESAAQCLTRVILNADGLPRVRNERWQAVPSRLLNLDPTYQVWIDWYNRRIEGHDAAFDIPGDTDRTEDKKILARLADATNEDFWDKGATYVNTTLQRWIDEAREQAAINYVASGAPLNLGSDAELAARDELASRLASVEDALAALKDQLASLTQTGHGGIGHNQPENATSLRDDEIITLKQQVASLETLLTGVQTQLATPVPDVGQLVQDVPKLNRWGRAMCVMADMSSDKVAEGFEKEIGAASARGLINVGKALVYTALCAFLLFFSTVWIPLLIG